MWLPFMSLALSASVFFNLALVYHFRRTPSIICRSARWAATLFFLFLGCAALVVVRDGLAANGLKNLRWPATCTWAIYIALPLLSIRHGWFSIIAAVTILYLVTFADVRLLLTAGLLKKGWISGKDDPFWWVENMPGFRFLHGLRVMQRIELPRQSMPGFLSLEDTVKASGWQVTSKYIQPAWAQLKSLVTAFNVTVQMLNGISSSNNTMT